MLYTAEVFGWMTIIDAPNKREAVKEAKARAPGASLLRSDVTPSHVHRSTQGEVNWYNQMAGALPEEENVQS